MYAVLSQYFCNNNKHNIILQMHTLQQTLTKITVQVHDTQHTPENQLWKHIRKSQITTSVYVLMKVNVSL